MTSYGKCSRKRGSEGCHEIDSVGAQTLTDLWVWKHLQFEVCENNLTVDLGSIAGNLSFLTFLSCQLWLNGFSEQACLFFFWFLYLFSRYSTIWISLSCIFLHYLSCYLLQLLWESIKVFQSCTGAACGLLLARHGRNKNVWGVLSEVATLWTATFLWWWGS